MNKNKIFYLAICAFGYGLATNLQVANLSTILQFSGFKSHFISYLWLIAPITGMIIQPIIGLLSDSMNSPYGRRRPLFLISTLLGVFSLVCLPYAHSTALIILLIILLDIGANGNAQLSRALILDTAHKSERTKAFSWSTALAGLGAMSAGALPWILIHVFHFSSAAEVKTDLPLYVNYTFIIGALCYLLASMVTLIMVREEEFTAPKTNKKIGFLHTIQGLKESIHSFPIEFWKLSYILFFAWMAIFAVWNYLNLDIAQTVFGMPVKLTDNLEKSSGYLNHANVLSSNYFGLLQLSSTLFALMIPSLNRVFEINKLFAIGLGLGGLSLVGIAFTANTSLIAILIIFYGIGWATLSTCPYTIFGDMIPEKNIGYNMGIFNILIVFPQIVIGLTLGTIYKYLFINNASMVILMAGFFLLIAMFLSFNSCFKGIRSLKGKYDSVATS
ncbi:MAG: MFS transporter [Legionella sp.]|nr:MFS transporter [Legionella sp.]